MTPATMYRRGSEATMANIPMSGHRSNPVQASSFAPLIGLSGAVVSLALVAGTGVWGYKLFMRDVSGVPVVQSVKGAMRISPENPGGQPAEHQGLSVNSVAAEGIAAKPADRLVLAPAPISLSDDDQAVTLTSLPTVEIDVLEDHQPDKTSTAGDLAGDIVAPPALKPNQIASIEALANQLASDAEPLSGVQSDTSSAVVTTVAVTSTSTEAASPTKTAPVMQGMVNVSLRPRLRPEKTADAAVEVASADSSAIGTIIDVGAAVTPNDQVPVGTRLVQLGAFASPEIAHAEWGKLSIRFEELLENKTRIIQKASSGGKVFYRLRAMGFADLSDARRLCSALKAEGSDCIPVVVR